MASTTLIATKDTFTDQNSPTNTHTADTLAVRSNTNLQYRMLLQWDLSSLSGQTVARARLRLTVDTTISTSLPRIFTAHAILSANSGWSEACSWNYADGAGATDRWAGDTGNDGGADAGCSVAGTDYNANPMGQAWIRSTLNAGEYLYIELSPSQVQAWVDGANYGMMLYVHSTEGGVFESIDTGTTDQKPTLLIDYAPGSTFSVQPDATAGKDTYVLENLPDNTTSTVEYFRVRSGLDGVTNSATQTGLIQLDLSSIPAGATILGATLRLVLHAANNANAKEVGCFRIADANSGWVEGASWNYANPSTVRWAGDTGNDGGTDAGCTVSGTDYLSTELMRIYLPANESADRVYEVSFGPNLSLIQAKFGSTIGFVFHSNNGFDNSDFRSSDHATAADRPKLVIWYTEQLGNPWYNYAQQMG